MFRTIKNITLILLTIGVVGFGVFGYKMFSLTSLYYSAEMLGVFSVVLSGLCVLGIIAIFDEK